MPLGATQSTSIREPHLDYYGGRVLNEPSFAPLYFGRYWSTAKGKADQSYLTKFGKTLLNSSHVELWQQYGFEKGKQLPAARVGINSEKNAISRNEIEKTIRDYATSTAQRLQNSQLVYTFYLPPGTTLDLGAGHTSKDGVGGYHSSIDLPNGQRIYYATIVYSQRMSHGMNGVALTDSPRDNITVTTSHEWAEAVTDPDVNRGTPGWYDRNFGEVGDIPINVSLSAAEVFGRIKGFAVQKEWSNKDHSALLTPTNAGAPN